MDDLARLEALIALCRRERVLSATLADGTECNFGYVPIEASSDYVPTETEGERGRRQQKELDEALYASAG